MPIKLPLYEQLESTQMDIASLDEDVTEIKGNISTINGNISTINSEITTIKDDMSKIPAIDLTNYYNKTETDSQITNATNGISQTLTNDYYTKTDVYTKTEAVLAIDDAIQPVQTELTTHKNTDRFRWQDVYNDEKQSIIGDAKNAGFILDETTHISVPSTNTPYTVNGYDTLLGVTMQNTDTLYCTVSINDSIVYSSEGLTTGVTITKWFWLKNGDNVLVLNGKTIDSTEFKADTNSIINILYAQLQITQTQLSDLQAGVDGKILDTASTINVETEVQGTGYTVTNALGGRINFTGLNVLLTTYALYVNGIAVRNGDLLGLGTITGDYDVKNGDVVTSIGMTSVTFTPYKSGS